MNRDRHPPRRGTRPAAPAAQVVRALLDALKEQERALRFYADGGFDAGRHARAARLLAHELLKGVGEGTEIHEGG